MKDMSLVMKEAHKMTKEMKKEFPSIDYKAQLGISISYLLNKKEDIEMVELKGTEKQIKWANSIRKEIIENCEKEIDRLEKIQIEKVESGRKRTKIYDKKINKLKEIIEEVSNIEAAKILIEESRIKYDEYKIKREFFA